MFTYQRGFDALGDSTRRKIFERLALGPTAVGELASELPVSRPAVSQHLKVLKDAGLVNDSRDRSRRIYRVDPDWVGRLRTYWTASGAVRSCRVQAGGPSDRRRHD